MHAIRISEYGGSEVMSWAELPRPGEVLVRLGAAGVNYLDVGAPDGAGSRLGDARDPGGRGHGVRIRPRRRHAGLRRR